MNMEYRYYIVCIVLNTKVIFQLFELWALLQELWALLQRRTRQHFVSFWDTTIKLCHQTKRMHYQYHTPVGECLGLKDIRNEYKRREKLNLKLNKR